MNVQLSASSSRAYVSAADDPYKKYWWVLLLGFVFTGAWLLLPIMDTPVGSVHVDASKPAVNPNGEQSLDSADNPGGASGSAIDLSMDGAGKRKSRGSEGMESMLYQAPPEAGAAAAGAPLGSASASSSASLAQQLKDVADKKKDASGWNEKAQRGFTSPHLGGGLSGAGSASGGSSASAGVGAFGAQNAQVGFSSTHGLQDGGAGSAGPGGSMQALRRAAVASRVAAASRSNDAARSGASGMFDGSKAQSAVGPAVPDGGGGAYSALDSAPANLKLNDPKLDDKKLPDPPATDVPQAADNNMGKQLLMMAATALIGGMIPGVGGQMVMMMGMMMMQQQQAQQAQQASAASQKAANARINSKVN